MTIQRRTFIDPSDIIGIEFECTHCHSRCSIPLDRYDRKVEACPNCNEKWLNTNPTGLACSDDQLISELVKLLKQVQGRTFGASIRLEIRCDAEELD